MRRLTLIVGLALAILAPVAAHAAEITAPPKPAASIQHDGREDGGDMADFSLYADVGDNGGDPNAPSCQWSFSQYQQGDPFSCSTWVAVAADNQVVCYTVTVSNSVGTSTPSDPACAYVAWTPPAPSGAAATQASLSQAKVTWADVPPSSMEGCCPPVESQVDGAACSSPCIVSGLTPGQHCFSIRSRYPVWAIWGPPSPTCVDIVDTRPGVRIRDSARLEGNTGTHLGRVRITLSSPASGSESLTLQTASGTATAPSDYVAKAWTVDIPAGATSFLTGVGVKGDTTVEPDEVFTVQVVGSSGVRLVDPIGQITIVNDD